MNGPFPCLAIYPKYPRRTMNYTSMIPLNMRIAQIGKVD